MIRPRSDRGWAAVGRAVRIGNDLAKMHFLLKNVVLDQFRPFLDLLDVRNGSGSKFRVYGWYREVYTMKISSFHEKNVKLCILYIGNPRAPTPPNLFSFLVKMDVSATPSGWTGAGGRRAAGGGGRRAVRAVRIGNDFTKIDF